MSSQSLLAKADSPLVIEPALEANQVYLGDCLELLDQIPENTVDLVLTDPPWFVSQEVTIHRSMNPKKYKYVGKDISLDFGAWDKFSSEEEYLQFTRSWFSKAVRTLREGGHLISFFDVMRITHLANLAREFNCLPRQVLYYLKTNPVPRARCVDFMVSLESALWITKGTKSRNKATFNYQLGQQKNYVESPIPGKTTRADGRRIHPTQKPIKVAMVWIRYLSNVGDLVVDPFTGSGAFCKAARILNRRFIGIEKDERFCRQARERVSNITPEFEGW